MKFAKIALFTLFETLAFGLVWDFFFDQKLIVLGSILAVPLVVLEHIVAKNTSQGLPTFNISKSHIVRQVILGVTEVTFWDAWRLIHERVEVPAVGPLVALVVFAALLILQHNAEGNVNGDAPFFSKILRSQGVVISVIESLTAFAWLLYDDKVGTVLGDNNGRLVALIPLFIGLLLEHYVRIFGEAQGANV